MRTTKARIVNFAVYFLLLQALPIGLYAFFALLAEDLSAAIARVDWSASFLLAGLAWLSIPNYLNERPWSFVRRRRYVGISRSIGALILSATVAAALFSNLLGRVDWELSEVIPNPNAREILLGLSSLPTVAGILGAILALAIFFLWWSQRHLLAKTSLRLLWKHHAQFVGFYCAVRRGFYEEVGLDVSIEAPDPTSFSSVDFLVTASDFAVLSAPDVITRRVDGFGLRSLCVLLKDDNIAFIARADSNIRSPGDFRERTVGVRFGYEEHYILKAMLKANKVEEKSLTIVGVGDDMSPFLEDPPKIEVWPGHVACEPNEAILRNVDVRKILPSRFQVPFAGDTVVTSDHMIDANPEIVRAFMIGTRRGWEFAHAREHREDALRDVLAFMPRRGFLSRLPSNEKQLQRQIQLEMVSLVFKSGRFPDHQCEKDWERMAGMLRQYGVIPDETDVSQLAGEIPW